MSDSIVLSEGVCLMSVRPRPGTEVPELTARVARAANLKGTTAMWVRDRLEGLWSDEDPGQIHNSCDLKPFSGYSRSEQDDADDDEHNLCSHSPPTAYDAPCEQYAPGHD